MDITRRCVLPSVCATALLLGTATVEAGQLYTWVDEAGVTHFSQWPPAAPDVAPRTVSLPQTNPPDYDPAKDPNSVLRQAERIHAAWSELAGDTGEPPARAAQPQDSSPRYREPALRLERRLFYPVYHAPPRRPPAGQRLRQRQLQALEALELAESRRPYSVNSSGHRARVDATRELPRHPAPSNRSRR